MDFGVRGSPTPRAHQRQLAGFTSRPLSGRSNRNPITGEETGNVSARGRDVIQPQVRGRDDVQSRSQSRPSSVPGLNLKYLSDEDSKPSRPIDVYEFCLQTPNTASTISWGTGRSQALQCTQPPPKQSTRPTGVPELSLAEEEKPPVPRKTKKEYDKESSEWAVPAVPENGRPLSARYQQMYKQYEADMKQSYRNHVQAPHHHHQDKVEKTVDHETSGHGGGDDGNMDDTLGDSWTKERYSTKQLMKKMDKEDLLEYNKKQKLIETVLADQLSRAVISEPEQDQRSSSRAYNRVGGRGSNRFLHDSKVRTRTTATENLLAKRVQFGARIITRNGHDAMRELTGFFFHVNNSLTIYEFRQFGKSAKAIPFISRGQYCNMTGPRKDQPYTILDIHSGSDILISTSGQHTLPASLSDKLYVKFRIINVNEEEKSALLESSRGQETFARLQFPCKEDYENQKMLHAVQDTVREKLKKRGIKTVTGLGRWYRSLDSDGSGVLTHHELEQGLTRYHIELHQESLQAVIDILDPDGEGCIDYTDYMHAVVGEMNEYRKSLVRKAYGKIDGAKNGRITVTDICKFFNTTASARGLPGDRTGSSAIQAFLDAVCSSPKQEDVTYVEFEEYYEGLSIGVEKDNDFANILRNTWTI